jgi:hypothetical protein
MFFRHPDGGGNLSHDGIEYKVDHRGLLELPDFLMRTAHELGYQAVEEASLLTKDELSPVEIMQMKRSDLMAYCADHNIPDYDPSMKSGALRDLIANWIDEKTAPAEPASRVIDPLDDAEANAAAAKASQDAMDALAAQEAAEALVAQQAADADAAAKLAAE